MGLPYLLQRRLRLRERSAAEEYWVTAEERKGGQQGFTIVELVTVMVLVGVLASVALPRFVGRGVFDTRGFLDQSLAAIQYARQQAVAQRRQICVAINGGGLSITRAPLPPPGGTCDGTALTNPATGAAYTAAPPVNSNLVISGINGTTLPLILTFDQLGRPNVAAALQISGENNQCLGVEAETGYVRTITCP